jgi:hypothetical protein
VEQSDESEEETEDSFDKGSDAGSVCRVYHTCQQFAMFLHSYDNFLHQDGTSAASAQTSDEESEVPAARGGGKKQLARISSGDESQAGSSSLLSQSTKYDDYGMPIRSEVRRPPRKQREPAQNT